MPRGKFIAIEGNEGAGKSKAIQAFKEHTKLENVLYTREPGGTQLGEAIRKVLLQRGDMELNGRTEFFLFNGARSQLMSSVIHQDLESGNHVISDRFDGSTFAYQIRGRQNDSLKPLFNEVRRGWESLPDYYIFFDVDPVVGLGRRNQTSEVNSIDKENLEFHQRVRGGFLEFMESVPHVVIDANPPEDVVREEFLRVMDKLLA